MQDTRLRYVFGLIGVMLFSLIISVAQVATAYGQERIQLLLETASGTIHYENRPVVLNINGNILPDADMPAIILQDRTFVPLRHVFESIGAVVDFHPAQQRIMIAHDNSLIVMHIGQYHFNHDAAIHQMDVAPQIINDRTMVPVSFVAGAMGFNVGWDENTFTVSLTQPPQANPPSSPTTDDPTGPGNTHYYDIIHDEDDSDTLGHDFAELSIDRSPSLIPGETNLETTVNAVNWTNDHSQFIISATSRISMVEWFMLPDGRLIIDIIHSRLDLAQSNFNINNGFIRTIRTGHNISEHGINISRIVFDLDAPVIYHVTLSHDRRHVTIGFEGNQIGGVDFVAQPDATRESVVITGVVSPQVNIFMLFDPLRLVIDLPNTQLDTLDSVVGNGRFVQGVRIGQFDATTTRVVVDLLQDVSFSVDRVGNAVIVHLFEPTYRNITFNHIAGVIEITKPTPYLTINHIVTDDRYREQRFVITLPGDFSEFFGYGTYLVHDNVVSGIEIVTVGGLTQLIVYTNRIMGFNISENADTIFIRAMNPRELYSRVVLIDPGHGGRDPGAVHHGMRESDIVLDVANMVMYLLNRDGLVRAYTTRVDDSTVPNSLRAEMANEIADIFVSIHFNAANARATGTEVLYTVTEAERGLSFNSRHMAAIFQRNLVEALGTVDRGIRDRPRIQVLNATTIPAVLVEIEFMDTAATAARIATQEFRWLAAQAIVDSIYESFGL